MKKAAERFANGFCEADHGPANIVVTPADEEAKSRGHWKSDEDEPHYRLFKATVRIEWDAREVSTFNPNARTA